MHSRTHPGSNDDGETLIELVLAMAIMGIAVVAIVAGIATSILMSDIHRKQATAGAYVRNYAESVESYIAAGFFDATASPNYGSSTVGFTAPNGFSASVTSLRCWNDGINQFSSCPASGAVQLVTLNIASWDSRVSETLTLIVRKP
jgi:type II secretory pathway pseudopilin PulG